MSNLLDLITKNYCTLLNVPTSKSAEGQAWQIIANFWSQLWPYLLGFLVVVVLAELLTRHKNEYNSANGFTPQFNRFVGSGTYMGLQIGLYFLVHLIFGNIAYCFPWPYLAHIVVFSLTFYILHWIGFWPKKYKRKY